MAHVNAKIILSAVQSELASIQCIQAYPEQSPSSKEYLDPKAPSTPTQNSQDMIQEDWPPTYDEYTDVDWCNEKTVDSQMFQDLIEENQSPIYDEYTDSDWYGILNSPLPTAQVRIDPPPKLPNPTRGQTRGSHEHCVH